MKRFSRSAFVIMRRDFSATVLSKAFILFLIGPLLPLLIGGTFAGLGAQAATQGPRAVVAVVATQQQFAPLQAARTRLAEGVGAQAVPLLYHVEPEGDLAAQQRRLLAMKTPPVLAVLAFGGEFANLTGAIGRNGNTARAMQLILEQAQSRVDTQVPAVRVIATKASSGKQAADRTLTAHSGQFLLFFLTMLLATMLLSQVIEEKSNKIIEVIAAAVPIDAMFVGKLFAMLAASLLAMVVWLGVGAGLIGAVSADGLDSLPQPAVGWPLFLVLAACYFATNYLTLGALFLGIGAQASSPREVQTLSLPVTILQVLVLAFAMSAVGSANDPWSVAAAVFPLSSPLVMIARAAESPDLWPHFAAVAWQALWVAVIIKFGAAFFRRHVLKSGPGRGLFRRRAKA